MRIKKINKKICAFRKTHKILRVMRIMRILMRIFFVCFSKMRMFFCVFLVCASHISVAVTKCGNSCGPPLTN